MDPNCLPPSLPEGWLRTDDGRVTLPGKCVIGSRDLGGWDLVLDPERTDGLTLAERSVREPLPRLAATGLARRSVRLETTLARDEDVLVAAWGVDRPAAPEEAPAAPVAASDADAPTTGPATDDAPLSPTEIRDLFLSLVGAE